MVPDRQKVWTDGMDGRTDDAKTISSGDNNTNKVTGKQAV